MGVFSKIRRLWIASTEPEDAHFVLTYTETAGSTIKAGHLTFDGHLWRFWYDAEFKARPDLRPIEGFDDLEKQYQSRLLFPFFAVRLPDSRREDVQKKLRERHVEAADQVDMLRLFGQRNVSSLPFELLESTV